LKYVYFKYSITSIEKKIQILPACFFRYDLPAGLSVFLVALPLCLGIALASGAPLYAGILSGVIGGVVVTLISNSALGVSGPAAGLSTIVASAIVTYGDYKVFLLCVVVAGLFQL
jgi:MFS superfamily sulfate permease-like transporter